MKSELRELQELVAKSEIIVQKLPPGPKVMWPNYIVPHPVTVVNGWCKVGISVNVNEDNR